MTGKPVSKRMRPPTEAASTCLDVFYGSASGCRERGPDAVEHRLKVRADGGDRSDDDDGDQRSDEAVLDCGNARFILGETEKQSFHELRSLNLHCWVRSRPGRHSWRLKLEPRQPPTLLSAGTETNAIRLDGLRLPPVAYSALSSSVLGCGCCCCWATCWRGSGV
jgi:hypothetical protein